MASTRRILSGTVPNSKNKDQISDGSNSFPMLLLKEHVFEDEFQEHILLIVSRLNVAVHDDEVVYLEQLP
jgi:hypothetical protein